MSMEKTHVCRLGSKLKGEQPVVLIDRHEGTQVELKLKISSSSDIWESSSTLTAVVV